MSVLSDEQLREIFMNGYNFHGEPKLADALRAVSEAVADAAIAADRAARAEPVAWIIQWDNDPDDVVTSMHNDDLQQALGAGWPIQYLYTAPPAAPVVPDDVAKDAERYRWIRKKTHCRYGAVFSFPVIDSLAGVRPGQKTYAERFDACIDEAMLAAAPAPSQEPTT